MNATYKFRVERQGKRKVIDVERPTVETPKEAPRVHPVARRLALAYFVDRCVEAGVLSDYADAARQLGITRARMTQILNLRLLSVDAQTRVLAGKLRPTRLELRALVRSET